MSETIRITDDNTGGVWDSGIPAIVISREKLRSIPAYAATLLHEAAHATTGETDVSRKFESVLTKYLGTAAASALQASANAGLPHREVQSVAHPLTANTLLEAMPAAVSVQDQPLPVELHPPAALAALLDSDASQKSSGSDDADTMSEFLRIAKANSRPNAIVILGVVCFSQDEGLKCCVKGEDGANITVALKIASQVGAARAAEALHVSPQLDEVLYYTAAVQIQPASAGSALLYKVQQREPVNLGPLGWAYRNKLVICGIGGLVDDNSEATKLSITRHVLAQEESGPIL